MSRYNRHFIGVVGSMVIILAFPRPVLASNGGAFWNGFISSLFQTVVNFLSDVVKGGKIDRNLKNALHSFAGEVLGAVVNSACENGNDSYACNIATAAKQVVMGAISGNLSLPLDQAANFILRKASKAAEQEATNASRQNLPTERGNNDKELEHLGIRRIEGPGSFISYPLDVTNRYTEAIRQVNLISVESFVRGIEKAAKALEEELSGEGSPPKKYAQTVGVLNGTDLLQMAEEGHRRVHDGEETKNEYQAYKGIADILLAHAKISVAGHTYLSGMLQHQMIYNSHLLKTNNYIYQNLLENQAQNIRALRELRDSMRNETSPFIIVLPEPKYDTSRQ